MDLVAIIRDLRSELQKINVLILALEALDGGRRRGRPPKALQALRAGKLGIEIPTNTRAIKGARKATKAKKNPNAKRG